ncbi:MAG: hypothetical protein HYS43_00715 [Candidatus Liptonbacteria bacterium]|nr:hypothetical protein [Candidatus Liptonbacteria bacterium]
MVKTISAIAVAFFIVLLIGCAREPEAYSNGATANPEDFDTTIGFARIAVFTRTGAPLLHIVAPMFWFRFTTSNVQYYVKNGIKVVLTALDADFPSQTPTLSVTAEIAAETATAAFISSAWRASSTGLFIGRYRIRVAFKTAVVEHTASLDTVITPPLLDITSVTRDSSAPGGPTCSVAWQESGGQPLPMYFAAISQTMDDTLIGQGQSSQSPIVIKNCTLKSAAEYSIGLTGTNFGTSADPIPPYPLLSFTTKTIVP